MTQRDFGSGTRETGEGQIRKVIREYEFVKKSNELLVMDNQSVNEALSAWREKVKVC